MNSLYANLKAALDLMNELLEEVNTGKVAEVEATARLSKAVGILTALTTIFQSDEEVDRQMQYLIANMQEAKEFVEEERTKKAITTVEVPKPLGTTER